MTMSQHLNNIGSTCGVCWVSTALQMPSSPSADGLDLTMKGTLNVMFDYCSIPFGTYFKLGAQARFLSNFEKSPYLCFWRSRLG